MTNSTSQPFVIPLTHFDNHGRLTPHWGFWASVLFLLRSYSVLIAALSFRQDSSALLSVFYPQQASLYQSLFAGIPVIVAVGCVSFREALAKRSLDWAFQLIVPLLVVGVIGDIVHYLWVAMDMHWRFSWAAAIAFAGNIIVALYLLRSRLLRAFVDDWREYAQSDKTTPDKPASDKPSSDKSSSDKTTKETQSD